MSICEWASVCAWLTPVTPLSNGTVQSSPRGMRGLCEQPPCPQSPCHITIRCCSRTANYACVWQPHCQGGENKTAGKWRMKRGRVNSVSLCGCVTVRVSREQDFVVILIWYHYGRESECLQTVLLACLIARAQLIVFFSSNDAPHRCIDILAEVGHYS